MILRIDAKNAKVVTVSLKEGEKVVDSLSEENEYGSQVLLPLIVRLLKQSSNPGLSTQFQSGIVNVNWKILQGIEVEEGPGSFTGLRVGASVAQALAFALNIPLNGQVGKTVSLRYT